MSRVKRLIKRAVDLVIATLLLALSLPLLCIVAVAVKLESRGPLFFRQRRSLSSEGPAFDVLKFRSMFSDADQRKSALREQRGVSGALFKVRDDPRVTSVGRVIRRCSIDELPQLLNVISGTMSLVGPRPLPVGDHALATESETMGGLCQRRAAGMPGITGLWQTCGRSNLGYREMVLLDLYYLENQTLFLDLEILLRTMRVVLSARGAC